MDYSSILDYCFGPVDLQLMFQFMNFYNIKLRAISCNSDRLIFYYRGALQQEEKQELIINLTDSLYVFYRKNFSINLTLC
jgi:hypothetical protein